MRDIVNLSFFNDKSVSIYWLSREMITMQCPGIVCCMLFCNVNIAFHFLVWESNFVVVKFVVTRCQFWCLLSCWLDFSGLYNMKTLATKQWPKTPGTKWRCETAGTKQRLGTKKYLRPQVKNKDLDLRTSCANIDLRSRIQNEDIKWQVQNKDLRFLVQTNT
jgi:hypothetical protein